METVGKRSNRLLIANSIIAGAMLVFAILIGIFAGTKLLSLIPAVFFVLNIYFIVDIALQPCDMIVRDGDDLLIMRRKNRFDRIVIKDIASIVYTNYSARSLDGTLTLAIVGRDKPIVVQSVKDVAMVRDTLVNIRAQYGYENIYDIDNTKK